MGQVPMPANRIQPGLQICNASLKSYCANVQYFVQLQYKANVLCIFALCIVHKYAIYVQWSGPVNDCSSRTNRLHQPTIQSPEQSIQFQVFEYFLKAFCFSTFQVWPHDHQSCVANKIISAGHWLGISSEHFRQLIDVVSVVRDQKVTVLEAQTDDLTLCDDGLQQISMPGCGRPAPWSVLC